MTKFLHTADLHIGKSRNFPDYLGRQSIMCDAIFATAREKTDGLIILSGDVYDSAVLKPREKDLFIERISKADQDGLTTVVINGNHDIIDQVNNGYTHLRTLNTLIDSRRLRNTVCVEFEPKAIFLEKFNVGIVAVPALYRKTKEVNAIVSTLARRLIKTYGNKIAIIAAIHETVIGSLNEVGFPFATGIQLDSTLPVTYFALGDVHSKQQIRDVPNAFYSGCPIQHDFSDSSQRGVLVVDTNDPTEPEFIPLYHKVPQLLTITAKESDDLSKIQIPKNTIVRIEATKQQLAEACLPDCVIRTKTLKPVVKPEICKPVGLDDTYDGLLELLSEAGMDPDGQAFCTELLHKIN